jgi:hypothetical protein
MASAAMASDPQTAIARDKLEFIKHTRTKGSTLSLRQR